MKIFSKLTLIVFVVFGLAACDKNSDAPDKPETGGGNKPKPEEPELNVKMPRKEMRAVWIATVANIDWPKNIYNMESQKKEFIEYLDLFVKYNVNAVVMQVRPMADAFYNSELEPWSKYITGTQGKDPGYDVMQFMIDETHKRGLEFHAWLNPYRISNNVYAFEPAPNHIYRKHPEWTMRYGKKLMFRPALPQVREYLVKVVDDLIFKYDVDGIHFDDYFYPYPERNTTIDDDGDFIEYGSGFDNIEDFRRDNVNKAIEAVHNLLVQKKPGILFSVSPYGVWRNKSEDPVRGSDSSTSLSNYDDLYADILLWCEKGWIDLVVPQLYATTKNYAMNFTKMSSWWAKNTYDCNLAIGYGIYRFGNPAEGNIYVNSPVELENEFFHARRQKKVNGSFLYNATVFKENKVNILSNLWNVYSERVLIPFMGRDTDLAPQKITSISAENKTMFWKAQNGMRYVIYKIADGTAVIKDIVKENRYECTESGEYSVSVLNRDNRESPLSKIVIVH